MKRLYSLLAAALILVCSSCSKGTPAQQAIDLINETTERISKANGDAEMEKISKDLDEKMKKIHEANPDYKATPEEQQKLQEAQMKLITIVLQKAGDVMSPSEVSRALEDEEPDFPEPVVPDDDDFKMD